MLRSSKPAVSQTGPRFQAEGRVASARGGISPRRATAYRETCALQDSKALLLCVAGHTHRRKPLASRHQGARTGVPLVASHHELGEVGSDCASPERLCAVLIFYSASRSFLPWWGGITWTKTARRAIGPASCPCSGSGYAPSFARAFDPCGPGSYSCCACPDFAFYPLIGCGSTNASGAESASNLYPCCSTTRFLAGGKSLLEVSGNSDSIDHFWRRAGLARRAAVCSARSSS